MRKASLLWLVVAAALLAAGCATYRFEGRIGDHPPALDRPEIAEFAYDRANPVAPVVDGKPSKAGSHTLTMLKWRVKDFPEMGEKNARAYFYEPKDKSKKTPALVILPPTGGPYAIVKPFAKYFADRGFTVIALRRRESFFKPDRPLAYSTIQIRQAVIDARRALDYLDTLDYVDPGKTALMGISLGGIVGALTMQTDGRVEAAGFLVSAAHMPDIFMTSGFSRVDRLREAYVEREDVSYSELRAEVTPILAPVDPARYAERIDPARLVMVNGAIDDIIVRDVVMKSRATYGNPTVHIMPTSHYTSIGIPTYANRKIYEHFKIVLGL